MTEVLNQALTGSKLEGVSYLLLPGDRVSTEDLYDVASWAVSLKFSKKLVTLSWRLDEGAGALVIEETVRQNPLANEVDVSIKWAALVGQTLLKAVENQHETDRGSELWSIRLVFGEGDCLVVALGERGPDNLPHYVPDSILITGSKQLADSYRIVGAMSGAWGSD